MEVVALLRYIDKICSRILQNIPVEDRANALRSIKQSFVERDYESIFYTPKTKAHLPVYVANYTPSRALAYRSIIPSIADGVIVELLSGRLALRNRELEKRRRRRKGDILGDVVIDSQVNVLCFGGGPGAEVIALVDIIKAELKQPKWPHNENIDEMVYSDYERQLSGLHTSQISIQVIDIGDFAFLTELIRADCPPVVSLLSQQSSVLTMDPKELKQQCSKSHLLSFFFTLNELFAVSKSLTCQMLTTIIQSMQPGCYLLVLESAGSFSELSVGSKEMMVFRLLDAVKLLKCVYAENSEWYRVPARVRKLHVASFDLNDMRYFVRLYRRI
jgi:25S rRNA (uracil2843-N3)-methyltransferase